MVGAGAGCGVTDGAGTSWPIFRRDFGMQARIAKRAIGMKAGSARNMPVGRTPINPASSPSVSDASGLLPAHAIAHTAITLA